MERTTVGDGESSGSDDEDDPQTPKDETPESQESDHPFPLPVEEDSEDARDSRTLVLSVLELEDLFLRVAPDLTSMAYSPSVDRTNAFFRPQLSRTQPVTTPPN